MDLRALLGNKDYLVWMVLKVNVEKLAQTELKVMRVYLDYREWLGRREELVIEDSLDQWDLPERMETRDPEVNTYIQTFI